MASKKMTYMEFAGNVIALMNGELEITDSLKSEMINKANDLINTQERKAAYNKEREIKTGKSKVSEATLAAAEQIRQILTDVPKTGAEIAEACGQAWTALAVSNYCKHIEGVEKVKVTRQILTPAGNTADREYTAYKLA